MKENILAFFYLVIVILSISFPICFAIQQLRDMRAEIRAIIMTQNHQFEVLKRELHFKDEAVYQDGMTIYPGQDAKLLIPIEGINNSSSNVNVNK